MLGLGIDTGGTCTDAVIYDFETERIVSYGKALTTKDNLETGFGAAIDMPDASLVKQVERYRCPRPSPPMPAGLETCHYGQRMGRNSKIRVFNCRKVG